jgi:hypothetical protein
MQRWKHRPEGSNWGDFGPVFPALHAVYSVRKSTS